jgi:predicted enzyme related to lactoylglutathione lyase
MAKYIHMMIRVLDENRSKTFYEDAFGFKSPFGNSWMSVSADEVAAQGDEDHGV